MKKYIVITLSLTLLLVTLTSCESYLEETNPNEISADIYWSSLEESESNLVSVYGAMLNEFIVNARVHGDQTKDIQGIDLMIEIQMDKRLLKSHLIGLIIS